LHDNASAHKAAGLPIFDPEKCYNPLSPPYCPALSMPDYFLFPKLKLKLKGLHFVDVAEIQEAELMNERRSKKRNFQRLFRNCTTMRKPIYIPVELLLNK
jgi:hypothetical protein